MKYIPQTITTSPNAESIDTPYLRALDPKGTISGLLSLATAAGGVFGEGVYRLVERLSESVLFGVYPFSGSVQFPADESEITGPILIAARGLPL